WARWRNSGSPQVESGTARCNAVASEHAGTTSATQPSSVAFHFRFPASFTPGLRHASLSVDPRWEPGAGNPLAGLCPGGGPKGPSLPEPLPPASLARRRRGEPSIPSVLLPFL